MQPVANAPSCHSSPHRSNQAPAANIAGGDSLAIQWVVKPTTDAAAKMAPVRQATVVTHDLGRPAVATLDRDSDPVAGHG